MLEYLRMKPHSAHTCWVTWRIHLNSPSLSFLTLNGIMQGGCDILFWGGACPARKILTLNKPCVVGKVDYQNDK